MTALEAKGLLDRTVETLPSPAALAEREARGEPLTRAELGVLLAYAKIVLFTDIVASDVPDDPHFDRDLMSYFPDRMEKKYSGEIRAHRLRREIIARVVANDLINRGGPSFVTRLQDATGRGAAISCVPSPSCATGFPCRRSTARSMRSTTRSTARFSSTSIQTVGGMAQAATAWDLKNSSSNAALGEQIAALQAARKTLEPKLASLLPDFSKQRIEERRHGLFKAGTPEKLAEKLAMIHASALIPDIALVARTAKAELIDAAKAFFAVTDAFRIGRIEDAARSIPLSDYYDGLALTRAGDMIAAARRGMAVAALTGHGKADDPWPPGSRPAATASARCAKGCRP